MDLVDAIRSIFGGGERDTDESDAAAENAENGAADESSAADEKRQPAEGHGVSEEDDPVPGGSREGGPEADESHGSDRTESDIDDEAADRIESLLEEGATSDDWETDGDDGESELEIASGTADDISEWTFDTTESDDTADGETDEAEGRETDESSDGDGREETRDDPTETDETTDESDDPTDEDDEPVSWEETGFEQLTTELVGDEKEEADEENTDESEDPADLITEAEPDRAGEPESGGEPDSDDQATESDEAAEEGASETEAASTNLPLSEGVEDEAPAEEAANVSEDSPRADFVSEAVDLAEFWAEYDLDFTVASLERLDALIEDQWDPERFETAEFGGDGYDSEVFTEQVRAIGSYLGELFVRVHGGTWTKQDDVGWTVDVPAGPDIEAAGATVTVFHIAKSALLGEATIAVKHDGVAEQLGLETRVGVADAAMLQQAGGDRAPQSTDEDVVERFREGAEDLADRWPDYDLDFSRASLSRLEELLEAELDADRFDGVELGDETDRDSLLLTAHAVGVGGYLAEVLRRERDASWVTDGRLVVVVESDQQRHEVEPIEVAVDCIRGERSLTDAIPE